MMDSIFVVFRMLLLQISIELTLVGWRMSELQHVACSLLSALGFLEDLEETGAALQRRDTKALEN
jgi:hypothetical protein